MTVLETALTYGARGWRCIPVHSIDASTGKCTCERADCGSPGKHPTRSNWVKAATTDTKKLSQIFAGSLNVGIVTGPGSDILVVDIEIGEGLENAKPLNLPPTYTVRTGSGGVHLYYHSNLDLHGGTHKLARKIDVRCHGGMVVAPPSVSGRGQYAVTDPRDPVELPQWIVDRLTKPHAVPAPSGVPVPLEVGRRALAYLKKCQPAVSGQSGHDTMFGVACRVGPGFGLSQDEAYSLLAADYNPGCQPPWSEKDLRHKIADAYRVNEHRIGWLRDTPNPNARPPRLTQVATRPKEEPAPAPDESGDEIPSNVVPIEGDRIQINGVVPGSLLSVKRLVEKHLGFLLGDSRPLRLNMLSKEIEQCRPSDPNPKEWELSDLVTAIRIEAEAKLEYETKKVDKQGYPIVAMLKLSAPDVEAVVLKTARDSHFHPVAEWLESLPPCEPGAIDMAASEALGLDDDLSRLLWRKWLIGCVARVMKPGCQFDTVLVLVAPTGGEKKSSAFRALVGDKWFSDTHLDMTGFKRQDSYMQLHRVFVYEIPELEGVRTERDRSRQKSFISSRSDDFRAAYEASVRAHPRSVGLGATTNSLAFTSIDDPAFNRRLFPLRIKTVIDVEMIATLRSQIWAEALAAYRAGEAWHLDETQADALAELSDRHADLAERDAWEPLVDAHVNAPARVERALMLADIMRLACGIEKAKMSMADQHRVGALLRGMGWRPVRRRWLTGRREEPKTVRWIGPSPTPEEARAPWDEGLRNEPTA